MTNLFSEFPPATKADWLAKVEKDLKGKPIDTLDWYLEEGLILSPFAHAEDIIEPYSPLSGTRSTNQWEKGVIIKVSQIKLANQEALSALENGATAICFELKKSPSKEDLNVLFDSIGLEWISTHFLLRQKAWKRFVSYFKDYLERKGYDLTKIACSFSLKGNILTEGKDAASWLAYAQALPKAQFLTIDAISFYKGTDHVVEELANTIAKGNDYLIALNEQGLDFSVGVANIQFAITLGDSYFLNIAKIRALSILWQQVLGAWNIATERTPRIEVHLTKMTQTDNEHYNKIKATAQAMSAVIGGASRLYIYPSDTFKDGSGTPFAQRIALNVQHLMEMESYLDRVIDPAAGSYYIEQLTDQLAEAAWKTMSNFQ